MHLHAAYKNLMQDSPRVKDPDEIPNIWGTYYYLPSELPQMTQLLQTVIEKNNLANKTECPANRTVLRQWYKSLINEDHVLLNYECSNDNRIGFIGASISKNSFFAFLKSFEHVGIVDLGTYKIREDSSNNKVPLDDVALRHHCLSAVKDKILKEKDSNFPEKPLCRDPGIKTTGKLEIKDENELFYFRFPISCAKFTENDYPSHKVYIEIAIDGRFRLVNDGMPELATIGKLETNLPFVRQQRSKENEKQTRDNQPEMARSTSESPKELPNEWATYYYLPANISDMENFLKSVYRKELNNYTDCKSDTVELVYWYRSYKSEERFLLSYVCDKQGLGYHAHFAANKTSEEVFQFSESLENFGIVQLGEYSENVPGKDYMRKLGLAKLKDTILSQRNENSFCNDPGVDTTYSYQWKIENELNYYKFPISCRNDNNYTFASHMTFIELVFDLKYKKLRGPLLVTMETPSVNTKYSKLMQEEDGSRTGMESSTEVADEMDEAGTAEKEEQTGEGVDKEPNENVGKEKENKKEEEETKEVGDGKDENKRNVSVDRKIILVIRFCFCLHVLWLFLNN